MPPRVHDELRRAAAEFAGVLGVYAKHLDSGETITHNAEVEFETASTIKVAVMAEVFRQIREERRYTPSTLLEYRGEHRVGGSGVLKDLTPGLRLPVRDAVHLMMMISDNVATNLLIDLAGVDSINAYLRRLGLARTTLHNRIDFDRENGNDRLGTTTPREFGLLCEKLYRGQVVNPEVSAELLEIMQKQHEKSRIMRYLPYDAVRWGDGHEPPRVRIATKTGSWLGVRHDAGVIFTPRGDYVIGLWSKECKDERYHVDNEAVLLLPRISRLIYDQWGGEG